MTTDPIRLNLPSASSFGMDVACPGRRQLLDRMGADAATRLEADDEDAARGTKIHKAFETGNTLELNEEEGQAYQLGVKHLDAMIAAWCEQFGITTVKEGERELRLWAHDSQLNPVISGQLDRHFTAPPHLIVCDLKSGFVKNLTPSERSWQLRVMAVLCKIEYPWVETIRVGFVKPLDKFSPTDVTDYTLEDLEMAERSMRTHLWSSRQPDVLRHAGPWCRYCPGIAACPEAGAHALLPSVIANPLEMVQQLAPADLVKLFQAKPIVEKVLEAVVARLKGMADDELAALGLKRGKPKRLDPITDTRRAFDKINTLISDEAAIFTALKFSKTDLADVIRRETGMSSDGASQWIREQLADYITEKSSEAPLVKV